MDSDDESREWRSDVSLHMVGGTTLRREKDGDAGALEGIFMKGDGEYIYSQRRSQ